MSTDCWSRKFDFECPFEKWYLSSNRICATFNRPVFSTFRCWQLFNFLICYHSCGNDAFYLLLCHHSISHLPDVSILIRVPVCLQCVKDRASHLSCISILINNIFALLHSFVGVCPVPVYKYFVCYHILYMIFFYMETER